MADIIAKSPAEFRKGLADQGIYTDLELTSLLKVAINAGQDNLHGVVLTGPPGTGKTAILIAMAKWLEWRVIEVPCNAETKKENLIQGIVFDESTKSGFKVNPAAIIQAVEAVRAGEKVLLLLDEWDKTKTTADTFLLHFLQQGLVDDGAYHHELTAAEKARLMVCVTMNDHREPDPAFRRRLRYIFIPPLPVGVVRMALEATHDGHPMLETGLHLYERSLDVDMEKPLTIQEFREWLTAQEDDDAVAGMGQHWFDMLAYTFLTKSEDDHKLLASAVPNGAIKPLGKSRWERARLHPPAWFKATPVRVKPQPAPRPQPTPQPAPMPQPMPQPAPSVRPTARPSGFGSGQSAPRTQTSKPKRFGTGNGFGSDWLDDVDLSELEESN